MFQKILIGSILVALVGCQSIQQEPSAPAKPAPEKPRVQKSDGVVITPYDHPEIKRQKVVVPQQKPKPQQFDDGRQLPAFKKLMQQTQTAYKAQKFDQAEAYVTQAQRLAPQSPETYLYLGMLANRKNKPANAQAFAQRGLSYAQSNAMKKQLWQVILKAGQLQKNPQTIRQAQKALSAL